MNFRNNFSLNKEYKEADRMTYLIESFYIVSDMMMEIEENDDKIQNNNCENYAEDYYLQLEKIRDGLMCVIQVEQCDYRVDVDYL